MWPERWQGPGGAGARPRGACRSSSRRNALRLGDQRSPSLKFVAGAGFEPATSGRDRELRRGSEDRGSPRFYAERPRGPLRSLTEPHGLWRSVSGRFVAAVRIHFTARVEASPRGRTAPEPTRIERNGNPSGTSVTPLHVPSQRADERAPAARPLEAEYHLC